MLMVDAQYGRPTPERGVTLAPLARLQLIHDARPGITTSGANVLRKPDD
jgi:hypothetical protein